MRQSRAMLDSSLKTKIMTEVDDKNLEELAKSIHKMEG